MNDGEDLDGAAVVGPDRSRRDSREPPADESEGPSTHLLARSARHSKQVGHVGLWVNRTSGAMSAAAPC